MPCTTTTSVSAVLPSSMVMTPLVAPTFFMASASFLPICGSLLAAMLATSVVSFWCRGSVLSACWAQPPDVAVRHHYKRVVARPPSSSPHSLRLLGVRGSRRAGKWLSLFSFLSSSEAPEHLGYLPWMLPRLASFVPSSNY